MESKLWDIKSTQIQLPEVGGLGEIAGVPEYRRRWCWIVAAENTWSRWANLP